MSILTKEEKDRLKSYRKLRLTSKEFADLPEYSMSTPTQSGSVGIKLFKLRTPVRAEIHESVWFVGRLEGDMFHFYRPLIRI